MRTTVFFKRLLLIQIRSAFGLILFAILPSTLAAQVKLGNNPATIDANSLLELESTDKGILIPRVTLNDASTEDPLSAIVPEGMLIYSDGGTEDDGFYYWDGTEWLKFLAGSHLAVRNLSVAAKALTNKTTTEVFDNVIAEVFDIGDELYFDVSDPVDYAGGDITINFNFVPMGNEPGDEVQWQIDYKVASDGGTVDGTTGTLTSGDLVYGAQFEEQDVNFIIPAAQLTTAEAIYFKISRIAIVDGNDPSNSGKPGFLHCNVRYLSVR